MASYKILVGLCATVVATLALAQTATHTAPHAPALQHTQLAGQRAKLIASDVQLLRLHEEPAQELRRLDAERVAACQAGPNSEACKAKTIAQQPRRAVLATKLQYLNTHVPQHKPSGCQGCHSSPGATPASDPLPPGLGGNKAPSTPGPSTGGNTGSSSGGGTITPPATQCFIATAAYGSPYTAEVARLRRFRDEQLLPHAWGRAAVKLYYEHSPPIARAIAEQPHWRAAVRAVLTPIVWGIDHAGMLALLLALAAVAAMHRRRRP
jgi:hypothetical protein